MGLLIQPTKFNQVISAGSGFGGAWKLDNELNADPFGVKVAKISFRKEEGGLRAVWPLLVSTGVGVGRNHDGLGF